MRMYDIIMKKRNGGELSKEEIHFFIEGYTCWKIRVSIRAPSVCLLAPRISMIFWLTSSRHSTKLSIAYSYFTSYNLTRKDPLKAGLFLSMHAAVSSFNDGKNARDYQSA